MVTCQQNGDAGGVTWRGIGLGTSFCKVGSLEDMEVEVEGTVADDGAGIAACADVAEAAEVAGGELSELETKAWFGFQRMRIEVNSVLARLLAKDFGLTEAEFVILLRLARSPGNRQRARDLGLALNWERSRLSRQVSRMEARGTVTRAPSCGDARGYDLLLTDEGRAAFAAAWPAWIAGVRHCFADALSPAQLEQLTGIADTIDAHYNAEHCLGALTDLGEGGGACAVEAPEGDPGACEPPPC